MLTTETPVTKNFHVSVEKTKELFEEMTGKAPTSEVVRAFFSDTKLNRPLAKKIYVIIKNFEF
jgi:hypothetical protein